MREGSLSCARSVFEENHPKSTDFYAAGAPTSISACSCAIDPSALAFLLQVDYFKASPTLAFLIKSNGEGERDSVLFEIGRQIPL